MLRNNNREGRSGDRDKAVTCGSRPRVRSEFRSLSEGTGARTDDRYCDSETVTMSSQSSSEDGESRS